MCRSEIRAKRSALLLGVSCAIYNNPLALGRIAESRRRSHPHVFSLQSGHGGRCHPARALRSAQQRSPSKISAQPLATSGFQLPAATLCQRRCPCPSDLAACRFGRRSPGRAPLRALCEGTLSALAFGCLHYHGHRAEVGARTHGFRGRRSSISPSIGMGRCGARFRPCGRVSSWCSRPKSGRTCCATLEKLASRLSL